MLEQIAHRALLNTDVSRLGTAVKHQVFISYPSPNEDIVKNLASRLKEFGVAAWVYSIDKTLAKDVWTEIEAKIQQSEVFIFVASKFSKDAQGQHRELSLALSKIRNAKSDFQAFPVVLDDVSFRSLPGELAVTNGVRLLDAHNVKSEAFDIAKTFFPDVVAAQKIQDWNYPRPGQWLEVCQIDRWIEEYFDLGGIAFIFDGLVHSVCSNATPPNSVSFFGSRLIIFGCQTW